MDTLLEVVRTNSGIVANTAPARRARPRWRSTRPACCRATSRMMRGTSTHTASRPRAGEPRKSDIAGNEHVDCFGGTDFGATIAAFREAISMLARRASCQPPQAAGESSRGASLAKVAGGEAPVGERPERWPLGATASDRVRAARVEGEPEGGRSGSAPCLRLSGDCYGRADRAAARGRQQRLRVGMLGRGKEGGVVSEFDDTAEIDHRDAVRDVLDDTEVVRNEEVGDAVLLLEIEQQV
jgi:hypothetical protein